MLTGQRREIAWVVGAFVVVFAGFGVGFALAGSSGDSPTPRRAASAPRRRAPVDKALRRAIGQKIMTRMNGAQPSRRLLRRIRRGEVGGVILFTVNARAPGPLATAVATLQRAAAKGGNPRLLIAVDQEGGSVRRLPWAPPSTSAAKLGADPARALAEGESTGRELRRVGVNLDLAPVLDAGPGSALGTRTFGATPEAASRGGCAFATGLRRGGVLTAAKPFPGLGSANANTDKAEVQIHTPASVLRAGYAPYRACPQQIDAVMVANAAYPTLGARGPAVFSRAIIARELREKVGFRGVVISDTLEAAPLRHLPGAATRAARAGIDILVYPTTEAASAAADRELLKAARGHPPWRASLLASAQRIQALKAAAG
jgi:beta-N-acetylhexosaminidase